MPKRKAMGSPREPRRPPFSGTKMTRGQGDNIRNQDKRRPRG